MGVLNDAGPRLRDGAVGFAVAAAFAGLFLSLETLSLEMLALEVSQWTRPQWAMTVSLLALGFTGVVVWVLPRVARAAAVVAVVSAVGVAGSAVWATAPGREAGAWAMTGRLLLTHAVVVLLIAVVARAWARSTAGRVRLVDVTLGAVVGTAAAGLPQFVEMVATTLRVPQVVDGGVAIVAGALVLVAGVAGMVALVGRVPAPVVGGLTVAAGVVLVVVAVRGLAEMREYFEYGGLRGQASLVLGYLAQFGRAFLVLALGGLLLFAGRKDSGPYVRDASAGEPAPTP